MYVDLEIREKPSEDFVDRVELALEFISHLGFIVGGGWGNDGKATLLIEPHDCPCKDRPIKTEISAEDTVTICNYLDKHNLSNYTWTLKEEDPDEEE